MSEKGVAELLNRRGPEKQKRHERIEVARALLPFGSR
jgi:hypothetical protein